jgi:hypothetical protein
VNKSIPFIFLAIFLCSCTTKKSSAQLHFQKASQLYAEKNIAFASVEIDSATRYDTANFDYLLLKAKIKNLAEFYDESNDILKRLLVFNSEIDTINFLIGENYFLLGEKYVFKEPDTVKRKYSYEQALVFYNKAIESNSKYFQAYFNKIKVLHNNEQYTESINIINTDLKIFPKEMSFILARGITKYGLDDDNGALNDVNFAIESNMLDTPNLSNALRFRATILLYKDSVNKALSDIDKAIYLRANDFMGYAVRGDIYKKMGIKDSACANYRKAADLGNTAIYSEIKSYCEK